MDNQQQEVAGLAQEIPTVSALEQPRCLNCGAALTGRYCRECGQAAKVGIPTIAELFHEIFEEFVHFESRLWQTLKLLLFSPGKLTVAYVAGKRASYVLPFRLYLTVGFVYVAVLSVIPRPEHNINFFGNQSAPRVERDKNAKVDCDIDEDILPGTPEYQRLYKACVDIASKDSNATSHRAEQLLPVFLLLLIALMAGLLKLLYRTPRFIEHAVFLFHLHATFSVVNASSRILQSLPSLAEWLLWPVRIMVAALPFYLMIYIFLALRRVYGGSALLTAGKILVILIAYIPAMILIFGTLAMAALRLH